jgi:hypothetical protein
MSTICHENIASVGGEAYGLLAAGGNGSQSAAFLVGRHGGWKNELGEANVECLGSVGSSESDHAIAVRKHDSDVGKGIRK